MRSRAAVPQPSIITQIATRGRGGPKRSGTVVVLRFEIFGRRAGLTHPLPTLSPPHSDRGGGKSPAIRPEAPPTIPADDGKEGAEHLPIGGAHTTSGAARAQQKSGRKRGRSRRLRAATEEARRGRARWSAKPERAEGRHENGNLLEFVSDLLDPISGGWDERLVRETFWPDDAHRILQIPLREGVQDFIAWHYDSKGLHLVKSANKLQVQLGKQKKNAVAGTSTAAAGAMNSCSDDSWKRLWKLPGPRNIQMFVWRLKHESLALRMNLKKRGIPVESTKCMFCGRADEDGGHLFIKCKEVKLVWRELALEKERMDLEDIQSVHVILDYLWNLDESKRMHILTFWWLWWSNRNKVKEGELPAPAMEVARRTRANVLQYMQTSTNKAQADAEARRQPPHEDTVKINLDGSIIPGENHAGWGVVARSSEGHVFAARAGCQDHVQDAFAAETSALAHAIALAADLGMTRVSFETDSMLLREAMDLTKVDSSRYAAVIEDMKYQLKMWFSKQEVLVCRRNANSVAHELAKLGLLYSLHSKILKLV